ncbi:MAG: hypothetical protein GEU73_12435 [Chloroflexi bacterium]|nr:hypothetical protein [Chloroflexota bacterium]
MSTELWFLLVFLVAAGAAIPLVMISEQAGRSLGLVDRPRRGEVQQHIVPRTGGYGVFLAFWLAILVSFLGMPAELVRLPADNARLVGVLLGSLALLPLAIVDDARRLGPTPQLVGHLVAATIPVLFGVRIDGVATPFGIVPVPEPFDGILAALWIVAMINAINLLDSMDGLAGGIVSVASGVLFLRTLWFGQTSIAVLPLALGGTCLGFLTRNWHPSRVILGSSGALFLGYMLGAVSLLGGAKIGTAALVLAVPILDVAWVAYRRIAQGRSPFRGGDHEHLPHRLRVLGMSDRSIVLSLYAVSVLVGAAALMMHSPVPTVDKMYLAAAVVLGVLATLAVVARVTSARQAP